MAMLTDEYITRERLVEVLIYDGTSGVFHRRCKRGNQVAGKQVGTLTSNGYLRVCIDRKIYHLHRLAWIYVHGNVPSHDVDHINGNRTDNRISNLRESTRSANLENLHSAKSHNTTGLLGANRAGKGFTALICVKGRKLYLGYFKTAIEAHERYLEAKRQLHEGCTI